MPLTQSFHETLSKPQPSSLLCNITPEIWWQRFCYEQNRIYQMPRGNGNALIAHAYDIAVHLSIPLTTAPKLLERINSAMAVVNRDLHRSIGPTQTLENIYKIGAVRSRHTKNETVQKQLIGPWLQLVDYVQGCRYYNGKSSWPVETMTPFLEKIIKVEENQADSYYTRIARLGVAQMKKGYESKTALDLSFNRIPSVRVKPSID